jgi:hypothetical protein
MALLILFDFGGFYYYDYYYKMDVWGYVSFTSGIVTAIIMLIGMSGFIVVARSAILTLRKKNLTEQEFKTHAQKSIQGAAIPLIFCVVAALVFWVTNLDNSWWLDTGFYGGLFGSLIVIIFSKMIQNLI